jgi:LacI family transcriptional regulator, galactose operon repressor
VATIADVARVAGVSIATVSRVLSPGAVPHPVRADTADRVREAARRLNFVPSPLARGLAARRSGLIGLVVPDLADAHYPQIAIGVEDRAREAAMGVMICNTLGEMDRMAEYLQLLQARRVDVILLSGATSLNAVELQSLQRYEVPMVLIGRPAIHVQWPHVSIDNRLGARLATRHLLDLGRTRIVHLSGPRTQTTMADRVRGYLDEMASLSAEVIESNGTPEDGYARLRARVDSGSALPDGVFAATDRLALAALAVAADRSLHVPGDIAVVGFDDIPLAAQLRPTLTSVAQPAFELGMVAVDVATALTAGQDTQPQTLSPRLVERESTRGPGGRFSR